MGRAGRRFLKFWTCGPICLALEIAKDNRAEEYSEKIGEQQQQLIEEGKLYEAQLLAEEEELKDAEAFTAAKRKVAAVGITIAVAVAGIIYLILKR